MAEFANLIGQVSDALLIDSVRNSLSFNRDPNGRLNATAVTLNRLISWAYNVPGELIKGGPAWIDSERYDDTWSIPLHPRRPGGTHSSWH